MQAQQGQGIISMVTGCVSSRHLHQCEGEGACGLHGLPHVLCVPVPPYARRHEERVEASPDGGRYAGGEALVLALAER